MKSTRKAFKSFLKHKKISKNQVISNNNKTNNNKQIQQNPTKNKSNKTQQQTNPTKPNKKQIQQNPTTNKSNKKQNLIKNLNNQTIKTIKQSNNVFKIAFKNRRLLNIYFLIILVLV